MSGNQPASSARIIRAVCYDEDGYVMSEQEIDEWFAAWSEGDERYSPAPTEMAVVTGTALPIRQNGDCADKGPGSYQAIDVIAEWDLLMDVEGDEVKPRWEMAKQIAEALTQRAASSLTSDGG